MKRRLAQRILALMPVGLSATMLAAVVSAQGAAEQGDASMSLRRLVENRYYRGQPVEGENRLIARGDSLWRILVQEKGLPVSKIERYLSVIRRLNPQIRNANLLRVGETIFIPMRLDEILEGQSAGAVSASTREPATGSFIEYRVRRGDYLHRILLEQLGIVEQRELARYYALVKDLNPQHKNWDLLEEDDIIRLPTTGAQGPAQVKTEQRAPEARGRTARRSTDVSPPQVESALARQDPVIQLDYARRLRARERLALLERIVQAIGSEVQREGEEVFSLDHGNVRLDRALYPIVANAKLQRKVIVDVRERIPPSMRRALEASESGVSVLPLPHDLDLQQAVTQLLARLGYQPLPEDRPVVVQEGGIALETRGTWMVLAPEESDKPQELIVLTLTDRSSEVPGYLRQRLAAKGLHLRDVVLRGDAMLATGESADNASRGPRSEAHLWPRDKQGIVDALLLAYRVPFGLAEVKPVDLREGLTIEARTDRVFEADGRRTAVFFYRLDPEIKRTLQQHQGLKVVELDFSSLSAKEIIGSLLPELGEAAVYREHRFALPGDNQNRLSVSAWGFLLRDSSLFLTDRQIPAAMQRFFFDQGLDIVFFE